MVLSADGLRSLHGEGAPAPAPVAPAAPAPAPAKAPRGLKPNRYPGDCIKCGLRVAAEAGFRDKAGDKWVVLHAGDCPATPPEAGTNTTSPLPTPPIWPGKYTLITEGGHRTFKVEVDPEFADGTPTIAFLRGRDNETDYTSFGFVKGTVDRPEIRVWKRFATPEYAWLAADVALFVANIPNLITLGLGNDPDPSGLSVGTILLAKYCIRCPAELTNPDSIRAGIGPVCATK